MIKLKLRAFRHTHTHLNKISLGYLLKHLKAIMLKTFVIKDQYCCYPFLGPHKKKRKYQKQFGKKKRKKNIAVRKHVRAQKKGD
jgi:hypothetical protein